MTELANPADLEQLGQAAELRAARRRAREAMRAYWCGYCDADPGQPCTTKTGHRLSVIHAARWRSWLIAVTPSEPDPDENRCPTCGQVVP
jgi:hypothetical protein